MLTLIIEVGRGHGLHGGVSSLEVWLCLPVKGIIAQFWWFVIQLVVKIFEFFCRKPFYYISALEPQGALLQLPAVSAILLSR